MAAQQTLQPSLLSSVAGALAHPLSALSALVGAPLAHLRLLLFALLLPPLLARVVLPRLLTALVARSSLAFRAMRLARFDEKGFAMAVDGAMGLPLAVPVAATVEFEGPVDICRIAHDADGSERFVPIASLPMPPIGLAAGAADASLAVEARVTVTDPAEFDAFAGEMMRGEEFVVGMRGRVGVGALGGWVGIRGGWLEKAVKMKGMAGLADVSVTSVQVLSGTPRGIQMTSPAKLVNPAPITADLGDVSFILLAPVVPPAPSDDDFAGSDDAAEASGPEKLVPLGSILMPNLKLLPGVNELPSVLATFHPDPTHPAACRTGLALLQSYLTNNPSTVVIRGYPGSTPIPYLSGAVSSLSIRSALPGLPDPFIESAELMLPSAADLWSGKIRSRLRMRNPFDCPMAVTGVEARVTIPPSAAPIPTQSSMNLFSSFLPAASTSGPTPLGTLTETPLASPIQLPAATSTVSPALPMAPLISIPALTGIVSQVAEGGLRLTVDVEAEMGVTVGEYDLAKLGTVGYRQKGVTVGVALA
ncbi:hypothetical protein DFJ74DRAFT_366582 [Hyaloraphidium curvatum]|nr:hypothetical protein DFJ74DRAFT_366582 [Hyaloraphidium curvatum]